MVVSEPRESKIRPSTSSERHPRIHHQLDAEGRYQRRIHRALCWVISPSHARKERRMEYVPFLARPCLVLTDAAAVIPFGRFGALKKEIEVSRKRKSEGGNGRAEEFWDWSEKQVQPFL